MMAVVADPEENANAYFACSIADHDGIQRVQQECQSLVLEKELEEGCQLGGRPSCNVVRSSTRGS